MTKREKIGIAMLLSIPWGLLCLFFMGMAESMGWPLWIGPIVGSLVATWILIAFKLSLE